MACRRRSKSLAAQSIALGFAVPQVIAHRMARTRTTKRCTSWGARTPPPPKLERDGCAGRPGKPEARAAMMHRSGSPSMRRLVRAAERRRNEHPRQGHGSGQPASGGEREAAGRSKSRADRDGFLGYPRAEGSAPRRHHHSRRQPGLHQEKAGAADQNALLQQQVSEPQSAAANAANIKEPAACSPATS